MIKRSSKNSITYIDQNYNEWENKIQVTEIKNSKKRGKEYVTFWNTLDQPKLVFKERITWQSIHNVNKTAFRSLELPRSGIFYFKNGNKEGIKWKKSKSFGEKINFGMKN